MSATQIDLSSDFNFLGIATDGVAFTGGMDGSTVYSGSLLSLSQTYEGNSYTLGSLYSDNSGYNCIQFDGQSIDLSGSCTLLSFLGTHTNGGTSETFQVNYSDSTYDTFNQSMSDWANPQNYSGETSVFGPMSYRDVNDGSTQGGNFYLYGYSFAVNPNKTLISLSLPSDNHAYIFAMDYVTGTIYTETGSGNAIGSSGELEFVDLETEDDFLITCEDGTFIVVDDSLVAGDNTLFLDNGVGSCDGTCDVVGIVPPIGIGSCNGTSTVSGIGYEIVIDNGVGTDNGTSTVSGIGYEIVIDNSVGTDNGTSNVIGIGIPPSVGVINGNSNVNGFSNEIIFVNLTSTGSSNGTSDVVGISRSNNIYIEIGSGGAIGSGEGFVYFKETQDNLLNNLCTIRSKKLFVKCRSGWVPVITRCNQQINDPTIKYLCSNTNNRKVMW